MHPRRRQPHLLSRKRRDVYGEEEGNNTLECSQFEAKQQGQNFVENQRRQRKRSGVPQIDMRAEDRPREGGSAGIVGPALEPNV